MSAEKGIRDVLPGVLDGLEAGWTCPAGADAEHGFHLEGQEAVYRLLDGLIAILLPGCLGSEEASGCDRKVYLQSRLAQVAIELESQVRRVFSYRCATGPCADCCNCDDRAMAAIVRLLEALPGAQALLAEDIQAAYEGDPAAKSTAEVVMSYPGVYAVVVHRIAHELECCDVPLIPRIMSEHAHSKTGIDIHPGATIGPGFFIDHGTGVVIGETCVIGKRVKLYQGVTLGALSFEKDKEGHLVKGVKRHPDVGDDVIIYSGATILGGDTVIGARSTIGGNVWLTHSVPPGSTVYNQQPKPIIHSPRNAGDTGAQQGPEA